MKAAILLAFLAFAGFVGWRLAQETACDPAYRACPVPADVLAGFMGAWCNAPSLALMGGPVRETLRQDGERVLKIRRAGPPGSPEQTLRVRFVVNLGVVEFREYDLMTDAVLPGRMVTFLPDADRRVVRYADGEATFLRCARMEALGVPADIRALY
jgi:hypothetical protein